jgi:hypothetical protein
MALRETETIIIPFAAPRELITPADGYRSTWLMSSLQALRDRGHLDAYYKSLEPSMHDTMRSLVVGVWVPMSLARAHYEACDRLQLGATEQIALGRAVSDRAQGAMLGTVVRMAKGAGVTPWTVLPQYRRLFERGVRGGGISVVKIGPKEARIDIVACELFEVPYFRVAFRGILQGIAGLFCRVSFIHDVPTAQRSDASYRFQWA